MKDYWKLYNLLLNEKPQKSDAVVWLQGDRYDRGKKVLEIYRSKLTHTVVISGNDILIGPGARPGEDNVWVADMKKYLLKNKVKLSDIVIDDGVLNTKEQAVNVVKLAKKNNWKKIILVSSAYHQPRVFLTFIKAANTCNFNGKITNQTFFIAADDVASGRKVKTSVLMRSELSKIENYQSKGDLVSYEDGYEYFYRNLFVHNKIKLRSAGSSDASFILRLRNDPKTRLFSHNTEEIDRKQHAKWLKEILKNKNRKVFIAESDKIPVGVVRADYVKDAYELSWTVAPEVRGHGVGKKMVSILAKRITKPLRAEVKVGNAGSIRIAESVGMKLDHEDNEILYFKRPAIKKQKNKDL